MKGNFDYLIVRSDELGWEIKQQDRRIVSTSNVVEAIDIANRLAEYEGTVHQRTCRVVIVDHRVALKASDK